MDMSWENLHFLPFSHMPDLNMAQRVFFLSMVPSSVVCTVVICAKSDASSALFSCFFFDSAFASYFCYSWARAPPCKFRKHPS